MLDIFSYMLGKEAAGGGGGGGSSSWELLATQEFEVSTDSTTAIDVGTVTFDASKLDDNCIVWVHVRDKAGPRSGYMYGYEGLYYIKFTPETSTTTARTARIGLSSVLNSDVGVYSANYSQSAGSISIKAKYNSNYGAIDGTFKVDVYKLSPASGMSFD